ncbi:Cofilin/actin depolymerizing factor [Oopsacas minuta]|uniref:Cofilin/actin depolymerizing factor n=1 Tax=Oopsacas minuta TaxID=111878 RepID=A0AAV7K692_9METZ|nr:Cofilin/actin depolymerizing factor [Oopsacas minuta]KAI6655916.1 Cofilin/actin depolymerizing factor [Oopsacas minuta]
MSRASITGIEVTSECIEAMNRVNKRTARAVIFYIKEQTCICVETLIEDRELIVDLKDTHETAEKRTGSLFAKVVDILKEADVTRGRNEPRYIFTNLVCEKKGRVVDKMVLFHFNPEGCGVREKMIYASSKGALGMLASMSFLHLHLSNYDDFEFEEVKKQVLFKAASA